MRIGRNRNRGATPLTPATPRVPGEWKVVWGPPLRWLGVIAVLLLGFYGLQIGSVKLREPGAFPLRHVQIVGELRNLAKADVDEIAKPYLGQNFFVANLDALHTVLAENPWIEDVLVRRQWPDAIVVTFRERIAFGQWGEHEMVDINGVRFRPAVVRQPGPWPQLSGPDGREKALIEAYQKARGLLDPVGLKLVKLVQDERRAWWLSFENGLEASMGRERFDERLQRLAWVYPRVLEARVDHIAVVDLRYLNGFAVRWKGGRPATPVAG